METIISSDGLFRYTLWRGTDHEKGYINFICLNPSTADATKDDPTVRACRRLTKVFGYKEFCITNLFAYRATSPLDMKKYPSPIGPENDKHLKIVSTYASLVICAWGRNGTFLNRDKQVLSFTLNTHCLGVNKDSTPKHPLYIPNSVELQFYV